MLNAFNIHCVRHRFRFNNEKKNCFFFHFRILLFIYYYFSFVWYFIAIQIIIKLFILFIIISIISMIISICLSIWEWYQREWYILTALWGTAKTNFVIVECIQMVVASSIHHEIAGNSLIPYSSFLILIDVLLRIFSVLFFVPFQYFVTKWKNQLIEMHHLWLIFFLQWPISRNR